jgi:hypothetical protein
MIRTLVTLAVALAASAAFGRGAFDAGAAERSLGGEAGEALGG